MRGIIWYSDEENETRTFVMVTTEQGHSGIHCLQCGRTSWNSNDREHRYCGYCHRFHDDLARDLDYRLAATLYHDHSLEGRV